MDSSVLIGTWERIDSVFWKFRLTTGRYAENRWGIIDGRWYYFDHNGRMVTDWQQLNGVWYYLATSEDVKRTEEIKEGEMRTGWIYDLFYQKWFYLDKDGAMATGWREIDGKWYYFNPAPDGMRGAMVTDAWVDDWYLNQDGIGINQTRR
jgi:glucan-binding YG repeat protein